MQSRSHTCRTALFTLLGVFFFFLALKNAQIAANGIKKGIGLATSTLIPSLFPFLVLSDLILSSGIPEFATKLLARPARVLFGLSENGAVSLLLGWLCGVPVGTVSALTMLKNSQISREEFERLLLFSNTPSTGFLIVAVGGNLFQSTEVGFVLFLITFFASVFTGIFLKLLFGNLESTNACQHHPKKEPYSTRFTGAVRHGFSTILEVTGFVLFFSGIAECICAITKKLSLSALISVLLTGILELTAGVNTATLSLPPRHAFCLCAFFAGFSGLSICLQLFSLSITVRPGLLPYLLSKLTQGVLSFILAYLYLALKNPTLRTATAGFLEMGVPSLHTPALFTIFFAILLTLVPLLLINLLKQKMVVFLRVKK